MKKLALSVIISTYNQPIWLLKVLWSYEQQLFKNFEVVIADDGSNGDTKELIQKIRQELSYPIRHIWHQDNGFQKTVILNKAILACETEYLVFTDGDCIARNDFLQIHFDERIRGNFLSGGYFKLPMKLSIAIQKEDIKTQQCFDLDWLKTKGLRPSYFKSKKLNSSGLEEKLLNYLTPTTASWNGHNSSCWKSDILKVNGFDERMQYGGEDRELGERLFNIGIKSRQIRYSAICLHLDHNRCYVEPEMLEKNLMIREETKKEKLAITDFGIHKE